MSPARRFSELFRDHSRPLLAYALRRVEQPQDAADIVAETMLVAWRRLDAVPAGDETRPWLFGVARRVLLNYHRSERRGAALGERLRASLADLSFPTRPKPPASRRSSPRRSPCSTRPTGRSSA